MGELEDALVEAPEEELELDELWSFVRRKSDKAWVWLALCRETRQVVAFVTGDRSRATCQRLWREIPERYKKATCYSDFWEAYQGVIPQEQHEANGARKQARPATSSDGSTPFDSGFRASLGRRSRSPSRAGCTTAA